MSSLDLSLGLLFISACAHPAGSKGSGGAHEVSIDAAATLEAAGVEIGRAVGQRECLFLLGEPPMTLNGAPLWRVRWSEGQLDARLVCGSTAEKAMMTYHRVIALRWNGSAITAGDLADDADPDSPLPEPGPRRDTLMALFAPSAQHAAAAQILGSMPEVLTRVNAVFWGLGSD
jgi:hypothetical protein